MLGWKKSFQSASEMFVRLPMAKACVQIGGTEYALTVSVSDSIALDALLGNDLSDFPSLLVAAASKNCGQAPPDEQVRQSSAGEEVCTELLESDDVPAQDENTADVSPCDLDLYVYQRTNLAALMQQFIDLLRIVSNIWSTRRHDYSFLEEGGGVRELRLPDCT